MNREAFTITKYDLQVRLEPDQQRLGTRGKITLRNDSARPQKVAVLQISSSLAWHSIKSADKPVQFVSQPYVSDIDHSGALSEAIVTLPAEIKPKESIELEIGYEGTITLDATRLTQIGVPEEVAKHASWDQISPSLTALRGAGYVVWYPITTEAADFSEGNSMFEVKERWQAREAEATMKLGVSTDAGLRDADLLVLCNGAGLSFDTREATTHSHGATCAYEPLGLTLPALASAKFMSKVSTAHANLPRIYFLPGHEDGAAIYATAIEPAAKFVGEWFGQPKNAVNFVDLPDARGASFESGNMLLGPMTIDDPNLAARNIVHMMVHGAIQSPRAWIHEGLAHFAEAVYREQEQDGRAGALVFLNLHAQTLAEEEKAVTAMPNASRHLLATTFDENYYRTKAAYVWWMLRDMIGDDALKAAIRKYRPEDDKDPKYMEQLISAAAKRDLGWFFDDWVYQDRGLPAFRVLAVHPWKGENGKQIVTVTIENQGGAGAEVPFTVRFDGGEIPQRIEVRGKSTASVRVEVPGTAKQVVINDGSVPESDLANNVFEITAP